jgi:hypothetical protein
VAAAAWRITSGTWDELLTQAQIEEADDVLDAVFEEDLELLCRTAGVRPTVAHVTGVARRAIISRP